MPTTPTLADILLAAAGAAVTLLIGGAVLYWIEQEWRAADRREIATPPRARGFPAAPPPDVPPINKPDS